MSRNAKRLVNLPLVLLILLTLIFSGTRVMAAPGDLDTGFGTDGKVTTAIGTGNDYGMSTAIQSDGKIVAAGICLNNGYNDFAVVRYNTDGSLDTGFGTDGKVITDIGPNNDSGWSVAIQSDGKIVVAGSSNNGADNDVAVVRYNTDGSLDTGFGTGGKVTTVIGSTYSYGLAIAIQDDGKIVVTGDAHVGSTDDFAVARYNTDGSLDTGFGTGGTVTTSVGNNSDSSKSLVIQGDGKIVAAGNANDGASNDFAMVRYNTDGSLDTGFGTGGKVITPIGAGQDMCYSTTIQNDGKIVLAGASYNGADYDFAVVRYNTDGSLDTGFGTDGKATTPIGSGNDTGRSAAIQDDGKIVLVGNSHNGTDEDFAVVRYFGDMPPTVTSSEVSNITADSASCGGNVTDAGSTAVTARGVCWGTSSNPTTNDSKTTDGSGTGDFTSQLTGLIENTTYYVRAYATNLAGTSYGEEKSFTATAASGDSDGGGGGCFLGGILER